MSRNRSLRSLAAVVAAACALGATMIVGPAHADLASDCSAPHPESRLPNVPLFYAKRGQFWLVRGSASSGPADVCFTFGNPDDIGVMGDWNGDGIETPGVFRPSNGTWYVSDKPFASQVDGVFPFGSPGDVPIAADWNNDGVQTLGVFRPSEGKWYITDHDRSLVAERTLSFASPGDVPLKLSGGNGAVTDLWAYRPSTATWWHAAINNSTGAGQVSNFVYGNPGDQAVGSSIITPGCTSTPIVFRPSNGTWYSRQFDPFQFGNPTDHMLVGPVVRPAACAGNS